MVLYGSTIPESKRFFKISELAGKRWPNVTEDEIYNWHDSLLKVPVACEGFPALVDVTVPNMWSSALHRGKMNLMAYWVFFPEFYTLPLNCPAAIDFDPKNKEDAVLLKKMQEEQPELFKVGFHGNSFFMVETDCSKGFAFNNRGFIYCWEFYDEKGVIRPWASLHEKTKIWTVGEKRIWKQDLLIKASSVLFLEQLIPELTSADHRSKDAGIFLTGHEDCQPACDERKESYIVAPGEKPLEGWKAIAAHAGISISTAQRRYKKIVGSSSSGKPFITTAQLDAYRVNDAAKNRQRKKT